jgi:inorganic pyrophosphatase
MIEFKRFIDAYAEVYNLQHQDRKLLVENAVRHLGNILEDVEDFRAILNYIKEFIEHYDNMKEHHLEAEIHQCMEAGDSFFVACREWDI